MGGVRVDAETQMSSVPGLFAAGECAGGLHGANRLGGNSLSDLLVFGKLAGEHAAAYATERSTADIDRDQVKAAVREALAPFEREGADTETPYAVQTELQELMQQQVGIIREDAQMAAALERIQALRGRARSVRVEGHRLFNTSWHTALDIRNQLTVAEAITRAALERKESRGAHSRSDFPSKDEGMSRVNFIVRTADDGSMRVVSEPIPEMRADLKQIIEEMK
jgi:succinate dehydrogenase / fumarate reductase flavoprotein subunit